MTEQELAQWLRKTQEDNLEKMDELYEDDRSEDAWLLTARELQKKTIDRLSLIRFIDMRISQLGNVVAEMPKDNLLHRGALYKIEELKELKSHFLKDGEEK